MNINIKDIFTDFEIQRASKSGEKPDIKSYPTVNLADHEPVSVINPSLENGPWIAGGACLRWYQGQPVGESDIDVFCKNAAQAKRVIDDVKSFGRYNVKFESENAVTLSYYAHDSVMSEWTIQIITRRYFADLREVINNFDLTVCEVGTAGKEWLLGPLTARDIRERNLRFKLPLQPDAPKRLTKYWTYGYRPVEGTVEMIQSNPNTRWVYAADEDYRNAF